MANTRLRKIAAIAFVNAIACADECVVTLAQSQGYTDVLFGSERYHLPAANYRMWVQNYDKDRDHAAFGFSAILPDIAPATTNPAEAATWGTGTGWHREIHVLVEYGRNFIAQEQQLDNAFAFAEKLKSMENKEKENNTRPMPPNAIKYISRDKYEIMTNGCKKYEGEGLGGNEVLQVCDEPNPMIFIECDLGLTHKFPYPSCKSAFNLSDKTQVTYSYGYDYFEQGQDIHHRLVELLMSFREKAPHP